MLRICLLLVLWLLAGPTAAQTLVGAARVIDGDTLVVASERIRLHGIDAPEAGQRCEDGVGQRWDCGAFASSALGQLVADGVRCEGIERDRYDRLVARCFAGERDIGAALVQSGAAFAYARYSRDYLELEAAAAQAGRGIWSGKALRPDVVRAAATAGVGAAPGACAIKGNISSNGKLYHLPGSRAYSATVINPAQGERWFCSESEALAAGWRKAGG